MGQAISSASRLDPAEHARPPFELLDGASLFLDFDGTLVDIADRPDAVVVGDRLRAVLAKLAVRLDGRMALVSGRPAAELAALFGKPAFTIAGSHGLEIHHRGGEVETADRPAGLAEVLHDMRDFAQGWPRMLVEDKPLGSALHYRLCPGAEEASIAFASAAAERHGLQLQTGKMMVEVRATGADKGSALRRLMRQPPMAGTRPVFVGDDDTDEPGFAAATELGGAGVLVGGERESAARYHLADAAAVVEWLEQACASEWQADRMHMEPEE